MIRTVRICSLLTLWLVPLLVFVSAFSSDGIPAWRAIGVPAMLPRFADLSTIPEGLETNANNTSASSQAPWRMLNGTVQLLPGTTDGSIANSVDTRAFDRQWPAHDAHLLACLGPVVRVMLRDSLRERGNSRCAKS
jgi:hypothetical protein